MALLQIERYFSLLPPTARSSTWVWGKAFVPLLLINSTLCVCCLRSSSCQSSAELLTANLICRRTWQFTLFSGSVRLIFFFFCFFCTPSSPHPHPPPPHPLFPLFKVKRRKAPSNPPALKPHRSEVPIGEEGPEMGHNGEKKKKKGGVPPNKRWARLKPWRAGWETGADNTAAKATRVELPVLNWCDVIQKCREGETNIVTSDFPATQLSPRREKRRECGTWFHQITMRSKNFKHLALPNREEIEMIYF